MTCIVFRDRALANFLLCEMAVTPGGVWLWYNPDEPANQITYLVGGDGRCAVDHRFSPDDVEFLRTYLEGVEGVVIADAFPSDWVWGE